MFERETDTIIQNVIEKIPPSQGGSITLKDMLAAEIPHSIKTFLHRDVEGNLLDELRRYKSNSNFNYDDPEVRNLHDHINVLLIHNYRFKATELHQRLDDVVHMMINYLIRPHWTLTNILFEHNAVISVGKVTALLRLFEPYEYLHEIIQNYVRYKNISSLTQNDFKDLIWKVDGEYMKRRTGIEAANMLLPLYKLFDFPANTGNNALPIRALIRFFEDKGLLMIIPRLEGEIVQGKNELRQSELSTILYDLHKILGPFAVEMREIVESAEENKVALPNKPEHFDSAPSPPRELRTVDSFNESERRRIIRRIFKDDQQSYKTTISALNSCTSWKQASKIIDEVFINFNIDPYGSDAEKFTSAVMKQYYRSA